jgi:hypothetical protein
MRKLAFTMIILSLAVFPQHLSAQDYMSVENLQAVKTKLKDNNRTLRSMKGTVTEEKKKALDTYYNHEMERIQGSEKNLEKLCASLVHELDELKIKKIMKGKHKKPFFDKKIKRFTNIKLQIETELTSISGYAGSSDRDFSEIHEYEATLKSSLRYVDTIIRFLKQKKGEKKHRK